jgi:5-methyltetrahydropteroyltriglutamate--homocysteine methyltransferase
MAKLLPTTLVGSYAQPDWLIDREKLAKRFPPRVRALELWRVAPEHLAQAQNDATLLAIHEQERAGLDIITDGEMRRESYSNRFATALEGVDIDNPGTALDRSGHPNPVPRVTGKIRRKHPVEVEDVKFLRANTDRMIKMTVPGPFTMSQQAQNDFYKKPGGDGARLRRGGQRRDQGPVRRGCGYRSGGRALHAGPSGEGTRIRTQGAQSRA